MNALFFQMSSQRKTHNQKMTKTLETNITSEKGDEKSPNITNLLIFSNNNTSKKDKNSLYLMQYQKYFMKKLVIKYNILPNEYNLMKLENFIEAKYCHSLARFKELLLFNYDEEFLKRFYTRREALKKIPLFSDFYKSYLKFFCFPTLAELKLNELIEDMVENKAKAFYNENYSNEKEKSDKKINVVIFTNKIRKDISRRNSLTNLTKTTIKNKSVTNRSSRSIITIEKIYNELNCQKITKKINPNSKSEDKLLKINFNNNTQINSGKKNLENMKPKNVVIFKKIENNSINNNIIRSNNNNNYFKFTQRNSKNKIKISRNSQSKIIDNKTSVVTDKKNISKVPIIKSLQKFNTKGNAFKNIFSQYNLNNLNLNNKKVSLKKTNSKVTLSKIQNQSKDIKSKYQYNNNIIKTNNNAIKHKANILIANNNSSKINNNNSLKIKKKNNYLDNVRFTQTITTNNNIPSINTNNFKLLPKRAIQVVKKVPTKKVKSRNYISIKDINTINIDARIHINEYNPNYYFTTNDKNMNIFSKKTQTTQNSKKKTKKLIKTEKKNNVIKNANHLQNSNKKLFSHLNTAKNISNISENSERKKNKTSLSPSLKNLILKAKNITYGKNNKINNTKTNKHSYVNSYLSSDSQRLVKNLKIGNA